jgi:hypothetical protein
MTQPISYQSPDLVLDFKNHKAGLMVFGILLIIAGALAGCGGLATPFLTLIPTIPGQSRPGLATILPATFFYLGVAGALITLGVGSVSMKRWVRPIVVVSGTLIAMLGILMSVLMLVMIPTLTATMQQSIQKSLAAANATTAPATMPATPLPATPAMASGILYAGMAGAIIGMVIFYIGIPGALALYYRQTDVRRTLEYYDSVERWTDRVPMPILALVILSVLFGGGSLINLTVPATVAFGTILTGPAAIAWIVLSSAGFIASVVLLVRMNQKGLAIFIPTCVIYTVSSTVSAFRLDPVELYRAMGMDEESVQQVAGFNSLTSGPGQFIWAIVFVLLAVYAFWARKYFPRPPTATPLPPPSLQ